MSKPVLRVNLANSIEIALGRHRKQNEQQVREAWLEAQLKSVGDGLIATSHDGTIWFINPEGERLLGISACDIVGRSFVSAVPLRNRRTGEGVDDLVRLAFLQGATMNIGEDYEVDRPGNRKIAGQVAISRFGGEPIGVVFTFRDDTVESYRQDPLPHHIVREDNLDCARREVNLSQFFREMEGNLRAKLPTGMKLRMSVNESVYPILANHNILETIFSELVGRAEEKFGDGGSVDISATSLDFEQREKDGSISRWVRLRIAYRRGETPGNDEIFETKFHEGLRIDFSMARVQSALQVLRATAHEGSAPGLTYWDIDLPAFVSRPAVANGEAQPAMVVLIEPDGAVRRTLSESCFTGEHIECLGARDAEEALDWVRVFPGEIDVVIVPEASYSSDIQTLLDESPTTSIMLIGKGKASATKLLEGCGAPSAVVDDLSSRELLRERLNQLLCARVTALLVAGRNVGGDGDV